ISVQGTDSTFMGPGWCPRAPLRREMWCTREDFKADRPRATGDGQKATAFGRPAEAKTDGKRHLRYTRRLLSGQFAVTRDALGPTFSLPISRDRLRVRLRVGHGGRRVFDLRDGVCRGVSAR